MYFRIWLDDQKQMVTCADYLICSDGTVYKVDTCTHCPDVVNIIPNTYLMRVTGYNSAIGYNDKQGSGVISPKELYEFDIVESVHLGIVYFGDCAFRVYFPMDAESELLADLSVDLVSHYFAIRHDPAYQDFIERIPDVIRSDK